MKNGSAFEQCPQVKIQNQIKFFDYFKITDNLSTNRWKCQMCSVIFIKDADEVEVAEAGGVLGLAITLVALRERHGEVVTVRSTFVLPDRRLDVGFLNLVKGFGQGAYLRY